MFIGFFYRKQSLRYFYFDLQKKLLIHFKSNGFNIVNVSIS